MLGWEDSPGEGNGNPLQHSCLENPMNRAAWQATVHAVAKKKRKKKKKKKRKKKEKIVIGSGGSPLKQNQ